jgi:TM2 domain-containing membrane protein YozV
LASVLWFFLSALAVHRFYLGRIRQAVFFLVVDWGGWLIFFVSHSQAASAGMALGVGIVGLANIRMFFDLFIPRWASEYE